MKNERMATPEVLEGGVPQEAWLSDEQIIEHMLEGKISAQDPLANGIFSRALGSMFNAWFARQEKKISGQTLARTYDITELGDKNAEKVVLYLPGMFDQRLEERAQSIFNAGTGGREESWLAVNALYSLRDIARVTTLMQDMENLIEERVRAGKIVTIVGYSCGGLLAKVLADRLSETNPSTCGLVAHNAPVDPTGGFFVRYANIAGFQEKVGFQRKHTGAYPLIVLNGSGDMIVPCSSCLQDESGEEIKTKQIPSTHGRSCAHPVAVKRIRAAVRAVEGAIPKFPNQKD